MREAVIPAKGTETAVDFEGVKLDQGGGGSKKGDTCWVSESIQGHAKVEQGI